MLIEWDTSELRLRRGRYTGIVDLLIRKMRNKELIHEKRSRHRTTCNCRLLKLLEDSDESIHKL